MDLLKKTEAIFPSCYFTEICTLLFNNVNILEHKIKRALWEEGGGVVFKKSEKENGYYKNGGRCFKKKFTGGWMALLKWSEM